MRVTSLLLFWSARAVGVAQEWSSRLSLRNCFPKALSLR